MRTIFMKHKKMVWLLPAQIDTGIVFLFLFSLTIAQSNNAFSSFPGNVSALIGSSVVLNWTASIHSNENILCVWEYSQCQTNPERVTSITDCTGEEFIGYDHSRKIREDISSRHIGWDFANIASPCKEGLHKQSLELKDEGWYRMKIFPDNFRKYSSPYSFLKIYTASDLKISLTLDNVTHIIQLEQGQYENIDLGSIRCIANRSVDIQLHDTCPPQTIVRLQTKVKNNVGLTFRLKPNNTKKLGVNQSVNLIFQVTTGIRGYPAIRIVRDYEFQTIDESLASTGHSATVKITVPVLVIEIAVLVASGILCWYCCRKH